MATYGRTYEIGPGQRERVLPGAFRAPLARPSGVVRWKHQGERPGERDVPENVYGAVRLLREQGGALIAECDVLEGAAGDHLLQLVSTHTVTGVSMSALVAESRPARDEHGVLREIVRVSSLSGVSLTDQNSYDDAQVLALREADRHAEGRRRRLIAEALAETRRFRSAYLS